jgi:hypothetical protein
VETGELNVSKSLEQTKAGGLRVKGTKSEEPRRFVIPDRAISVLAEHRTEQENDKRLFGSDYEDHGLIFCQPGGAYYSPDGVGARVVELMRRRTGACQPAFLTALCNIPDYASSAHREWFGPGQASVCLAGGSLSRGIVWEVLVIAS